MAEPETSSLRAEQLSVSNILEIFDQGMTSKPLNAALDRLHQHCQPALQQWERQALADKAEPETLTAALLKMVDGTMFDAVAIYSPQAQARIYGKMIEILANRQAAVRRNIDRSTLLSRHILSLCMTPDFQSWLDEDLRGIGRVSSMQQAVAVVCNYCEISNIYEFDKYGVQVKAWAAIETMFLAWLDRKNQASGQHGQELRQQNA